MRRRGSGRWKTMMRSTAKRRLTRSQRHLSFLTLYRRGDGYRYILWAILLFLRKGRDAWYRR